MAATEVAKGKYICTEGQELDAIHIIVSGSVKASFPGGEIILKKGDIVGLCDIAYDSHVATYSTLENTSFVSFSTKAANSLSLIIQKNPEVAKMMFTSMLHQTLSILTNYAATKESCASLTRGVFKSYELYQEISARNNIISRLLPQFDQQLSLKLEEDIESWLFSYYSSFHELSADLRLQLASRSHFLHGFLMKASSDIHSVIAAISEMSDFYTENIHIYVQENRMDLLDLYTSLLLKLPKSSPDYDNTVSQVDSIIDFIKSSKVVNTTLLNERVEEFKEKMTAKETLANHAAVEETGTHALNEELLNSIDTIIEYAAIDEEKAAEFKLLINKYKKLKNKDSSDDASRKLRSDIANVFLDVYSEAFIMSVKDKNIPRVLKMFFNFGYVDEELAGVENANYLLSIIDGFTSNKEQGVYTAHEWLMSVYRLEKEPSRNEFDVDYFTYLHERRVAGKITQDIERRLADDPAQRALYELQNMFPQVNKVTYGRISTYCPVFSEHEIIKPLNKCLVNADAIAETEKRLEAIDYGAFYREVMYSNESAGVAKEYIYQKVLPDVIIFPNIGTRGIMWQEIEGAKRNTPSRYMISAFHLEDLQTTFTRLVAEYRWEMCKRIQGARWNDVSEKSLTSEYCDYAQFYKKNSDLSQDAKEKVKLQLVRAKNSFKEMFVRDYLTWVMFEGTGAPRLNKVARGILCTYCPFPLELRNKVSVNPIYKDIMDKYNIKMQQNLKHLDAVIKKIASSNNEVPKELISSKSFIEGTI